MYFIDINSTSIPEFMNNNNSSDELKDVSSVNVNFQFSMRWDKMSAKEMYNELLIFVESGELEAEDIPKIATIQNWISTYT
ncbi:unnamed protein product [Rhizophagus irregularis]|nr:unnamed protein product [Rhizophagus irregularis]